MKLLKKRRPAPAVQPPQDPAPSSMDLSRRISEPPVQEQRRRSSAVRFTYGGGRRATAPAIDAQTGERLYKFDSETSTLVGDRPAYDVGELMHSLTRDISAEDLAEIYAERDEYRPPGEPSIASLPADLWELVGSYLSLADVSSLAFATKTLKERLSGNFAWKELLDTGNKRERLDFLFRLDKTMPLHLLCTQCATFHPRTQISHEVLKADFVNNPLFVCPKVKESWLPRSKLTYRRELPFAFIQLATRQRLYGALYGIPASSLDRRWKCAESQWSHASRYVVVRGHLLMRIISQRIAPPNMMDTERRLMLLDRTDYNPYFSACAHWKSGDLMKVCKCTLSHIPEPPERLRDQLRDGRGPNIHARNRSFAVSQCEDCRDIRRCPQCPTEYLIQIKMVEATSSTGRPTFKHAIQVTRWSDLGNGSSPLLSREWASCCGYDAEIGGMAPFDSFKEAGKRTINGIFEAETNNHLFLRRVVSLNPKRGEMKPIRTEEWQDRSL